MINTKKMSWFFAIISVLTLITILTIGFVLAHSDHQDHSALEQAEAIINVNIPCDKLSQEELEYIGEYYMEKMHPGEAHELMDQMMGGEGSKSLKQMHISMAKILYCNETNETTDWMMGSLIGSQMASQNTTWLIGSLESMRMMNSYGMMGMMPMMMSMMSSGMMNGGMMNMMGFGYSSGMMSSGWFGFLLLWLIYFAIASFVFGVVFWLAYKLIIKSKK